MAAGRVEEEGGTGICADQIWPDLLTCFVLALLLLSGFILLCFIFFFLSFPMLSCHFFVQAGPCELLVPLGSKHPSFSGHAIAPFSSFLPTCSFSKNERSGNLNDKGKVQIKERLNTMFIDSDTFFSCILSPLVLGSIEIRNHQWGNTFKNIHPFRSVLK